jgi:hypothetical protein
MLIERITLEGNTARTMREIAPEITLQSTPSAYPVYRDHVPLQREIGDGCYITTKAPNPDSL